MQRVFAASAWLLLGLVLVAGLAALAPADAQEKVDNQIAVLAGEWKITYTHDAVRVYSIERDGKVSFTEGKLNGQINRKDGMLLLTFEGDNKLERLTLGT